MTVRTRHSHDAFRQEKGAFDGAMTGIAALKRCRDGISNQYDITTANLKQIKDILELAKKLGAAAHHIFLLVPTGRARIWPGKPLPPLIMKKRLCGFIKKV